MWSCNLPHIYDPACIVFLFSEWKKFHNAHVAAKHSALSQQPSVDILARHLAMIHVKPIPTKTIPSFATNCGRPFKQKIYTILLWYFWASLYTNKIQRKYAQHNEQDRWFQTSSDSSLKGQVVELDDYPTISILFVNEARINYTHKRGLDLLGVVALIRIGHELLGGVDFYWDVRRTLAAG